jgi:signal transduction histidine kinase
MRVVPSSIRGRLFLAAFLFTAAALLFASLSIGEILDRFVRHGLDESLDAEIALLARSVKSDGSIDRAMLTEIGPFTQHEHGWGWRIQAPGGTVTSRTIVPLEELRDRDHHRHGPPPPPDEDPDKDDLRSGMGPRFYGRTLVKQASGGVVTITAAAPREVIDRQRRDAVRPLLLSVCALGLFLLAATILQLRIGLRPLARLKVALGEVRAGRTDRIPADQPAELQPVVDELNHLLDENAAALSRARGHVANLAHSLKTPLATLSLRLAESGRDADGELGALAEQIDRAIRHHLGRARAASAGAPGSPQISLAPAVQELVHVLGRIHAERGIAAGVAIGPDLSVKCDPQDLDEMLGNLLDNGWRWAASRIDVAAIADGNRVHIHIDDDGPGLSEDAIAQAMVPGQRLDERTDGHGFGLPIARELAELHGGTLALSRAPLGGLRVTLVLPA